MSSEGQSLVAGLLSGAPSPQATTVRGHSKLLEISFSVGATLRIPFGLMRVYAPSAEVQGHGPGQEVLQTGKRRVDLHALEPVGNYAVQPAFSDGHNSGISSRDHRYFLGSRQEARWAQYTGRLQANGVDRDAAMPVAAGQRCAGHRRGGRPVRAMTAPLMGRRLALSSKSRQIGASKVRMWPQLTDSGLALQDDFDPFRI